LQNEISPLGEEESEKGAPTSGPPAYRSETLLSPFFILYHVGYLTFSAPQKTLRIKIENLFSILRGLKYLYKA